MSTLADMFDTIVVVMLENRSFDHVLGFLSHESYDARTGVNGLHLPSPNFAWANPDGAGNAWPPTATPDGYLPCDLPHARAEVQVELRSGAMDGFVQAYLGSQSIDQEPVPMRFCEPKDIQVTAMLARNYCVCDRWFASLPNDTLPNRLMAISGTTLIDSTDTITPPTHYLPNQHTVFDWLDNNGKQFEIYVDANHVLGTVPSNLLLMQSQHAHVFGHGRPLAELQQRWSANGRAPDVIYCEPFYNDFATVLGTHGTCNHPPLPMGFGERFLLRVYQALTSNPEKWARTVMVVCYDEHGGFFDHVPPPPMRYAPPAGNNWLDQTPFTSLGVRIPGIVVSPLVDPCSSFHGLLDHTSILQLIVDRFGVPADLGRFGEAQFRKAQGVQSLASVLAPRQPRAIPQPAQQVVPGGPAPQAGDTKIGRMFRGVVDDLRARQQGTP